MSHDIVLSQFQIIDLLFRFSSSGILLLLFTHIARDTNRDNTISSLSLVVCIIGYILLTAPIDDDHYGWLRPPLLLITNCTIYAVIAVYWRNVHGTSLLSITPLWARVPLVLWFSWLFYFFLVNAGRGAFHTWHDGLSLLILIIIIIDALRGLNDDLVESRRDIRKLTITFTTIYMTVLTCIELFFRTIKDDMIFSLVNSFFILVITLYLTNRIVNHESRKTANSNIDSQSINEVAEKHTNSVEQKLLKLMQAGIYRKNGLTIAKLAEEMNTPQHQLRKIINQNLDFENFSQFLNSYRIPEVCKLLKQPEYMNTPILTLALENGYNSIAPFNRAFKEMTGMTPSDYRKKNADHFQK